MPAVPPAPPVAPRSGALAPWRTARVCRLVAVGVVTALALTACSAGPETPPSPDGQGSPVGTPAADEGFEPVELDNCGFATTVESAPERVVAVKSSTFELVLALGLEERLVGAAFLDGEVPERYAAAAAEVPVIADAAPGREAVLALEPDLVLAGWESTFSADGAGERSELEAVGVTTYVAPAACKGEGYMPDPLTFDAVFAHITEAGRVLGAPDAAAELVPSSAGRWKPSSRTTAASVPCGTRPARTCRTWVPASAHLR